MNIDGFSEPQRQGLLDLIVLAMYTDGNLALAEASYVDGILTAMGFATAYDRHLHVYGRTHPAYFTTKKQKRQACDLIEELLSSDNQVAAAETRFLEHIRQEFQL